MTDAPAIRSSNCQEPLVSIIMPAHNAAPYIAEALDSVLAQTWPHWELLVIDDASTDGTAAVVATYTDPRIRYMPVARIGSPSGVRNVGLKASRGEFIAFLDADDVYYPESLARRITALAGNPELQAVYGFPDYMDTEGQPLPNPVLLGRDYGGQPTLPPGYPVNWKALVTGQISCMLPALMLRRSLLEAVGPFNETLCGPEDYEFYLRLYLQAFDAVTALPFYAYRYRIHAASLTKAPEHYRRLLDSCLRIVDWLFAHPELPRSVLKYRSLAYADVYRYLARERLLNRQPALARVLASECRRHPAVSFADWAAACLPLILRSYLPARLDGNLVTLRWLVRNRVLPAARPVAKPMTQWVGSHG